MKTNFLATTFTAFALFPTSIFAVGPPADVCHVFVRDRRDPGRLVGYGKSTLGVTAIVKPVTLNGHETNGAYILAPNPTGTQWEVSTSREPGRNDICALDLKKYPGLIENWALWSQLLPRGQKANWYGKPVNVRGHEDS